MELLLSSQVKGEDMPEDDPQMSYMISAWARICKILGARFAPYLPLVMDPVMKTASMKPEVSFHHFECRCRVCIFSILIF